MSEFRKLYSQTVPRLGHALPFILFGLATLVALLLVTSGLVLFNERESDAEREAVPTPPGHVQVGEGVHDVLRRYSGGIWRVAKAGDHTLLRIDNLTCAYYVLVGPEAVEAVLLVSREDGPAVEALAADYRAGASVNLQPQGEGLWLDVASKTVLVAREDGVVVAVNEAGLQALGNLLNNI